MMDQVALAEVRTRLANERTFLAYIRTFLAVLVTGCVVLRFASSVPETLLGVSLCVLAWVPLVIGFISFYRVRRSLRK